MSKLYKRLAVLFACFAACWVNSASAANMPYIDKAKIRLSIAPGESKYGEINVDNPTGEAKTIKLYLEDWKYNQDGSGSKEFLPANSTPLSCASWIAYSPAEIELPAFGRKSVNYAIKAPADASGGHYAVLFFETDLTNPPEGAEKMGAGIGMAVRIACLFYIEAEGTIKRAVSIDSLDIKKDNGLSIKLGLTNIGNIDMTAGASYHIMDSEGLILARGEFNDVYSASGASVGMSSTWKEPIPKGKYDLVLTLDIGKAAKEAGLARVPVITKEAEIEIGDNGQVVSVGELK